MQSFKNTHQQDVEEILASIRSSIAEESATVAPREPLASAAQAIPGRDEHAEFELPAMFKQQSLTQALGELRPRSRPLPRLRDEIAQVSINNAITEIPNNVTDISVARRSDASARPAGPNVGPLRMGHHFAARPSEPALEPAPAAPISMAASEPYAPPAAAPSSDFDPTVPRQMVSFKDTKMSMMNAMSRPLTAPAPKPLVPSPAPAVAVVAAPVERPRPAAASLPPPVPENGSGGTDDIAAQLLRPMLKAWLTENMPKIVEKALRSESDEDRR